MLTLQTSTLRALPGETSHAPANGSTAADPAGFASLLRQTQVARPAAPAPDAVASTAAAPAPARAATPGTPAPGKAEASTEGDAPATVEAPNDPPEAADGNLVERGRAGFKGRSRSADAASQHSASTRAATSADAAAPAETAAAGKSDPAAATNPAGSPTAIDPNVLHWLAGLQRNDTGPVATAKASTRTPAAGDADAPVDAGAGSTARPGSLRDASTAASALDPKDKGRPAGRDDVAADARAIAAAPDPHRAEPAAAPIANPLTGPQDTATAMAATVAATPPPLARTEAVAAAAVAIATPVTAPEFAQALGVHLSVLARDGIQQAELQLNPAEMGPVSVQIVMDGTQARVDFGADLAATRHAIEAGLPELASALREAGFTLAGGGVSQHASHGGGQGDTDANGRGGRSPRDADTPARGDDSARVVRRSVRLGGVDLYA